MYVKEHASIPDRPYYVTALDSAMTAFGAVTANKMAMLVFPCESLAEATTVEHNACSVEHISCVRIRIDKPVNTESLMHFVIEDRTSDWFNPDGFQDREVAWATDTTGRVAERIYQDEKLFLAAVGASDDKSGSRLKALVDRLTPVGEVSVEELLAHFEAFREIVDRKEVERYRDYPRAQQSAA
jgi:hypothetical protein